MKYKGSRLNYKLPFIIFTAALTAAVLMLLALIPDSVNHTGFYYAAEKTIYEENGVYDLTGLDFSTGLTAFLRFNYVYYPNVYLTTGEIETAQSVDFAYSRINRSLSAGLLVR